MDLVLLVNMQQLLSRESCPLSLPKRRERKRERLSREMREQRKQLTCDSIKGNSSASVQKWYCIKWQCQLLLTLSSYCFYLKHKTPTFWRKTLFFLQQRVSSICNHASNEHVKLLKFHTKVSLKCNNKTTGGISSLFLT